MERGTGYIRSAKLSNVFSTNGNGNGITITAPRDDLLQSWLGGGWEVARSALSNLLTVCRRDNLWNGVPGTFGQQNFRMFSQVMGMEMGQRSQLRGLIFCRDG
ncbi:hypothetical protein CDAR_54391 [Caerostris darwini]|uniref:Uncharacterized protein n=1 Tax=Caerostris darwini TaxID=1538125 RepID=A0AAV4W8L9_9ARAC|nr:hypothetical protein CDAR_54391 [Caerostris darwini]